LGGGSRLSDYAVLALAVANISTASILVRLAGVHGFVAATWRLALGSLLTLALLAALYAAGRHRRPVLPRGRDLALAAASGAALALHFDLWMVSLFHLSVALSVTVVDSYPAVLAVVGRLVFGERYTGLQLAGALTAMAGVAGIAWYSGRGAPSPPGGDPVLGFALAFAGMLAVAAYFSIGRGLRERYTTLEYTLPVYATAAAVSAALTALVAREPLTGYGAETYLYLVLLAVLPMLGGHTLINYALGRLTLLAATVPVLGEPVGAAILAWALLGEPLGPAEALLMTVTLAGIAAVLLGEKGRR
jgi:drug/metabolite transporter (DMT)-like permease